MDIDSAGCMILLMLLLFAEAVYCGFSEALGSLGDAEQEELEDTAPMHFLLRAQEKPDRFIESLKLWGFGIGLLNGLAVIRRVGLIEDLSHAVWWKAGAIVLLLIIAGLGSLIPRKCSAKDPLKAAKRYAAPAMILTYAISPLWWIVYCGSAVLLRLFRVDIRADYDNVTEEEIVSMVNEGHEQGVLEASEAEMINNIIEFGDKEASDIMVHRSNMNAIDAKMTLREVREWILTQSNSRFPVYEKNIDEVIGVLYFRDVAVLSESGQYDDVPIERIPGLLRRAYFIPETRNVSLLFREMQKNKVHIAIVVDEYGQTSGLLTMEDILEEIVGNIMDEYDEEEESVRLQKDGSYLIDGMAHFDEVAEKLGLEITEEDDFETLNGYLIAQLERIPQEGEHPAVICGGYDFHILRIESRRISLVRAQKSGCDAAEMVIN